MPTPKQVRHHYARLKKAHHYLEKVLYEAHSIGVINYPQEEYHSIGPCASHYETWKRIEKTTERQLANAMKEEISRSSHG